MYRIESAIIYNYLLLFFVNFGIKKQEEQDESKII